MTREESFVAEERRARALRGRDTPEAMQGRREMIHVQLVGRDIRSPLVLDAMWRVPRHMFVPAALRDGAYADTPLPIGFGQTISQPYVVALMMQLGRVDRTMRALDVGTGSGWQAALLGHVCRHVESVEVVPDLAEDARLRLSGLGFDNVFVRLGDGSQGIPARAPFDVILAGAAPANVPAPLVSQLAVGGRLVIPVGEVDQELVVVERLDPQHVRQWRVLPVRFVPMVSSRSFR